MHTGPCSRGIHEPGRLQRGVHRYDFVTSACRYCGQQIVKSPVTRRWFVAGMLG